MSARGRVLLIADRRRSKQTRWKTTERTCRCPPVYHQTIDQRQSSQERSPEGSRTARRYRLTAFQLSSDPTYEVTETLRVQQQSRKRRQQHWKGLKTRRQRDARGGE
eukprot:753086-Hanusia_phi.AAC.1